MSFTLFKIKILQKMVKGPKSSGQVASIIASEYDKAVRSLSSGDLVSKNRILIGNKQGLESYIVSILNTQSKSTLPLDVTNLIAKGFPIYWTGATMGIEYIPSVPAPGSVFNISVVSNVISNPGVVVPIPTKLGKSQSTDEWINNLVKAAREHLKTVSGTITTVSAYVPGPPPLGITPNVGIITWTGYNVLQ